MPRTTLKDRQRKSRIREREQRQYARRLRKLDQITDEQIATLKKIKAAEAKNKPIKTDDVPDWAELREMGTVKTQEGNLVLTSVGAQVVSQQGG
jgi:hypothetical protein